MRLLHSSIEQAADCASAAIAYLSLNADGAICPRHPNETEETTMALLSSNYASAHDHGRLDVLRGNVRARYEAWKVFRRTRRELESLSDRELDDLGLSRADLPAVARRAAFGE